MGLPMRSLKEVNELQHSSRTYPSFGAISSHWAFSHPRICHANASGEGVSDANACCFFTNKGKKHACVMPGPIWRGNMVQCFGRAIYCIVSVWGALSELSQGLFVWSLWSHSRRNTIFQCVPNEGSKKKQRAGRGTIFLETVWQQILFL